MERMTERDRFGVAKLRGVRRLRIDVDELGLGEFWTLVEAVDKLTLYEEAEECGEWPTWNPMSAEHLLYIPEAGRMVKNL